MIANGIQAPCSIGGLDDALICRRACFGDAAVVAIVRAGVIGRGAGRRSLLAACQQEVPVFVVFSERDGPRPRLATHQRARAMAALST
jgi:hypothetical protein